MKELQMGARVDVQTEKIKLPSWIPWIGATSFGYALGTTLSSSHLVDNALRPFGPVLGGILNVLIYGAVVGIFLSLFQLVVMPRRLVPFHWWILATLAGAAIGFAVASVMGELLGNLIDPKNNIVLGVGAIAAIAGAIIGLAIGVGQWLVLRKRLSRARRWIMASIIGTALGSVTVSALLGLFELPLLSAAPSFAVGAILGIGAGIFQGLVLRSNRGH